MRNLADLADQSRGRGVSIAPRGSDFVRAAIALAKNGTGGEAELWAEQRWGAGSRAALATKAVVEGMTTGNSNLGAFATEFFAAVAERSIIGRLSGVRRVPLSVRLVSVTGSSASWVGEGRAKPIVAQQYRDQMLAPAKVLAAAVVTTEVLDAPEADAEAAVRSDLTRAVLQALDTAFIDPANAGVVDNEQVITPAAITNGLSAVSGTANPVADLKNLMAAFGGDLDASYLVMPPLLAVGMSGATFPNVGARGGNVAGIPVVTSRYVPVGVIALVDPGGIAYGEGGAELRVARDGLVEMSDAPIAALGGAGSPSAPVGPDAGVLLSLWQQNCVALVVGRHVNWGRARSGSVALITGATYGDAA